MWKNRSIDYSKCEYLPDKKKYSNSNESMLFLKKTDETIWTPPSSAESVENYSSTEKFIVSKFDFQAISKIDMIKWN